MRDHFLLVNVSKPEKKLIRALGSNILVEKDWKFEVLAQLRRMTPSKRRNLPEDGEHNE